LINCSNNTFIPSLLVKQPCNNAPSPSSFAFAIVGLLDLKFLNSPLIKADGGSFFNLQMVSYSPEDAVKLVTEQKLKPAQAARKLGVPSSTFDKWIKKSRASQEVSAPLSEDPRVLSIQVRDLREQVKRLEMEKEILKKATAFFAKERR
jgi:transposase